MLSTQECDIKECFEKVCGVVGSVTRVKKIRDYAFIHFSNREWAVKAMTALNGKICFVF